jgi:hypothetical protein
MERFQSLVSGLMLVSLPSLPTAACGSPERVVPMASSVAPMSELSGLAVAKTATGLELLAVGDESYDLLVVGLEAGTPDWSKAYTVALPMPKRSGGSELEGVVVDAAGRVVVVAERGEVMTFELSADRRSATLVSTVPIVFPAEHPLAAAWQNDANARAEGIVFVGERVFIAKQKDPVVLIELVGESLEPKGFWELSGLDDASEVVAYKGALFVVGARSNKLCEYDVPAIGQTGSLVCRRSWELPERLGDKGKARWEGLAFAADGSVILAVDSKKMDRPNIAVMPPLVGR